MNLSYRARRRWSLVILLIGLPAYIVVAISVVNVLERPPIWAEFLIYLALGIIWALPFKYVFRGIGQPDPADVAKAAASARKRTDDDGSDRPPPA